MADPITILSALGIGGAVQDLAEGGVKDNKCCNNWKCCNGDRYVATDRRGQVTLRSVNCCVFGQRSRFERGNQRIIDMLSDKFGVYAVQDQLKRAKLHGHRMMTGEELMELIRVVATDYNEAKAACKAGQYFAQFHKLQEENGFEKLGDDEIAPIFNPDRFVVQKGKNLVQEFTVAKVRVGIEKAHFNRTLESGELNDIVAAILSELARRYQSLTPDHPEVKVAIPSTAIRNIALSVLYGRGLVVEKPNEFDLVPTDIRDRFATLKHDADLRDEDRARLLKALLKAKKASTTALAGSIGRGADRTEDLLTGPPVDVSTRAEDGSSSSNVSLHAVSDTDSVHEEFGTPV